MEVEKRQEDEEKEEELNDDEEEEEEKEDGEGTSQLGELERGELEGFHLVTLAAIPVLPQNGSREDNAAGGKKDSQLKEQGGTLSQEVLGNAEICVAEAQTDVASPSSVCPTSLSESSQTTVTQSITSTFSPTLPDNKLSPSKVDMSLALKSDQQCSVPLKTLSLQTQIPDGYSWRKYGQKQVKSPNGSRSYYRCTYFDCCAKKIECSDHSGHVIEIVNRGTHSHDLPRKNNFTRDSPAALSARTGSSNTVAENSLKRPMLPGLPSSPKKSILDRTIIPERKDQNLCGSDGNRGCQTKGENINGPDPKRRMKKGKLPCPDTHLKTGKKPKIVVHTAGDVGISADGYRWRKYGQKMVKGKPYPRNYYRCTSAGCPVRKQTETALDNSSAVIITYKGVHDHDMPVPKKRHGPRNAALVAAVTRSPMNNLQLKKADFHEITSSQRLVGKEGEITRETMDVSGDGEKKIESARTLISIGIEIKQC